MRSKIIVAALIAVVPLGTFAVCLFSGVFTPQAPVSWQHVRAGISRSEALALAGAPQESGWPEKIVETWERRGRVCHRRLRLVYEGERVQQVWDGTWLRGCGWTSLRKESP